MFDVWITDSHIKLISKWKYPYLVLDGLLLDLQHG